MSVALSVEIDVYKAGCHVSFLSFASRLGKVRQTARYLLSLPAFCQIKAVVLLEQVSAVSSKIDFFRNQISLIVPDMTMLDDKTRNSGIKIAEFGMHS